MKWTKLFLLLKFKEATMPLLIIIVFGGIGYLATAIDNMPEIIIGILAISGGLCFFIAWIVHNINLTNRILKVRGKHSFELDWKGDKKYDNRT